MLKSDDKLEPFNCWLKHVHSFFPYWCTVTAMLLHFLPKLLIDWLTHIKSKLMIYITRDWHECFIICFNGFLLDNYYTALSLPKTLWTPKRHNEKRIKWSSNSIVPCVKAYKSTGTFTKIKLTTKDAVKTHTNRLQSYKIVWHYI